MVQEIFQLQLGLVLAISITPDIFQLQPWPLRPAKPEIFKLRL